MKGFFQKDIVLSFLILFVAIPAYAAIDVKESVAIGGIRQWITIKGTNEKNPILLYLHGGPGNSAMGHAERVTKELQKYFVVVQWDQRESGKTAALNHSDEPLTVALMETDGVEVINFLRKKFSRDKIYLVGHSWGGFLGLMLAHDYPELFEACFAVSPMIHQDESERQSLLWLKEQAEKNGNTEQRDELAKIQVPFQTADDLYYHRKWLAKEMGVTDFRAKSYVEAWGKIWLPLFLEASHINLFEKAPEIKCPVYFIVGSRDRQTYFKLTEDYFKMLKAEKKDLFWFTSSHHSPNLNDPAKFQQIIISKSILKK